MKTYRVAILGCRGRGTAAARAYHAHPRTEIVALCDLVQDLLDTLGDELGVAARYTDLDAMIGQHQPDIVAIPTGTEFHHSLALRVLEYGVHIDIEKPLCVDCQAGRRGAGQGSRKKRAHRRASPRARRRLYESRGQSLGRGTHRPVAPHPRPRQDLLRRLQPNEHRHPHDQQHAQGRRPVPQRRSHRHHRRPRHHPDGCDTLCSRAWAPSLANTSQRRSALPTASPRPSCNTAFPPQSIR